MYGTMRPRGAHVDVMRWSTGIGDETPRSTGWLKAGTRLD